jgi:hypothetical protein
MSSQGRNLGKLFIFSKSGRISKDFRSSMDGRIRPEIVNDEKRWPLTCDFYVQTANLSAQSEKAAAMMGAQNIVLPEGLRFLLDVIDARVFAGEDIWVYFPGKAGDRI